MDCQDARDHLLEYQRGQVGLELRGGIRAHLESCAACARAEEAEQVLTELLEQRLPQYPAPLALKQRLAAQWPSPSTRRPAWWTRWGRSLVPAAAVAIVLLVAIPWYYESMGLRERNGTSGMVKEAVNDYMRVLSSQHPLDIESGGIHQVKPWFEGRLDFAPVISFEGDRDFPLKGGAVGYFLDRKAAVFVYGRRLHTISLFVFRSEGLPWPTRDLQPMGKAQAYQTKARGFNVILWRAGELGYALVSDLDSRELFELGVKLSSGS
jgi:anti-sigma factor (TIGR02949 family)